MNCPKCNAQLMDGAKFCGSCGLVLQQAPPPSQQQVPQPQQSSQPQGGAFHFDTDGRGQGRGYTWAIEHQGAFALAVVQLQAEQAIAAEALPEQAIVDALAPGGVTDDGVGDMLHVPAQLVLAAGPGGETEQRIARGRVAVDGYGQFDSSQPQVLGERG